MTEHCEILFNYVLRRSILNMDDLTIEGEFCMYLREVDYYG